MSGRFYENESASAEIAESEVKQTEEKSSSTDHNSGGMDRLLLKKIGSIDVRYKTIIISALIWGLLAHGMGLFNKYTVHDEVTALFSVGTTIPSGRWMLENLKNIYIDLFQHLPFSLPLINGIVSIVLIAVSACLIVRLLDIKGRFSCIALTGVMVTTPVIAGLFGYMYTAPYYMIAFLMTTLGCYLIGKVKMIWRAALGVILITCAVGVYQAFYPVALTYLLFFFIKEVFDAKELRVIEYLKKAGYYLLCAAASIGLYFLINWAVLTSTETSMGDYQNISSMGQMGADTFFARFISTFRIFVSPAANDTANIYAPGGRTVWFFFVILTIILAVVMLAAVFLKNVKKGIMLTLPTLLIPCAVNGIFIMCDEATVHTLMVLNCVAVFVYFVWLYENIRIARKEIGQIIAAVGVALVFIFSICYTVYDNIVYLYADIMHEQAVSYFTGMEAQIKSAPGYDDDLPVAFVNYPSRFDMSGADKSIDNEWLYEEFGIVTVVPYEAFETEKPTKIIYDYNWTDFMRIWTGYNPKLAASEAFEDLPEVQAMPSYPDDGSIKVINDTVVVKF